MIYKILRWITRFAVSIYYRRIEVSGAPNLELRGPMIILSNHPNTLMDPLILAAYFRQQLGFLANASIFVNGLVNRVFHYLKVIPVYRQQDLAPGQVMDNAQSFGACYQFLESGGALMIFPEGTSIHELKLRKIKTGGVRIGFGVEEKNDFQLGVRILPVGLYYSQPLRFRSKVYLNIGDPIELKDFQNEYRSDEVQTVQSLTDRVRDLMEGLTIHIPDDDQERLFIQIKKLFKHQLSEELKSEQTALDDFTLNQEVSRAIRYLSQYHPEDFDQLHEEVERLDQLHERLEIRSSQLQKDGGLWWARLQQLLGLLLGFPFYAFGLIHNYLPYKVPRWIAKKITAEKEYHASVSMVLGMFVFPVLYAAYLLTIGLGFGLAWYLLLLYFALMSLTGLFSHTYYRFAARVAYAWSHVWRSSSKQLKHSYRIQRNLVGELLQVAKSKYMNRNKKENDEDLS